MNCSVISVRRLAWACGGLSAGIALCLLPKICAGIVILCAVVVCALLVLKGERLWRMRAGLFVLFFAAGVFYGSWWSGQYREPLMELDGTETAVCARALDVVREKNNCQTLLIRFRLPGKPECKAMLYDFDRILPEVQAGDLITGELRLRRADQLHGKAYDGYFGRGIFLLAYPKSELSVQPGKDWRSLPRRLGHYVEMQVQSLFPEDVSAFEKALLTGEKDALYAEAELSRAISRAGIAHIVAVSGMHVSFIVGMLVALCGTRRAAVLGIPAVLLFMLMTGMTPSVVRAGILCVAVLIAPLFRRESDGMTMLLFALAVLLLQNPAAAASIGLQLSFGAVLGIMLWSESLYRYLRMLRPQRIGRGWQSRCYNGIAHVAAVTMSASAITCPLSAEHFGYLAPYGLLTNLLTSFVVAFIFGAGYLACILAVLYAPLGAGVASVAAWGARYVLWCARRIAALPGSALYLENPIFVQWIGFAVLLFMAAWFLRGKEPFHPLLPAGLAVIALCGSCMLINFAAERISPRITVLDVGQGQCIILTAQSHTVVIDCGGGGTMENAGESAGKYLRSRGIKKIDAVILTHLHADHANGVSTLMEMVQTDGLIFPDGADDSDGLLELLTGTAEQMGTEIYPVSTDMHLTAGKISVTILAPLSAGSVNERGLILRSSIGSFDMLVTGDIGASTERALVKTAELNGIELLIAGHHGSAGSSSLELMAALQPAWTVISVGYNHYGHPSDAAIQSLTGFGAQLYRTDLNGNVTFYIGEEYG